MKLFRFFLSLILLLPGLLLAQTTDSFPLKIEFGSIFFSSNPGDYQAITTSPITREKDNTRNYRLGLFYEWSPGWEIGASLTLNRIRENLILIDPDLVGQTVVNANAQVVTYASSEEWLRVRDFYSTLHIRRQLFRVGDFEAKATLGISALRISLDRNRFDTYGDVVVGNFEDNRMLSEKVLPGVFGGLRFSYHLHEAGSIFLGGTYLQGFGKAEASSTSNIRYVNTEIGLSLHPFIQANSSRRNTVMVGIGFPFGISYERLLVQSPTNRHSLRLFLDQFLFSASVPGAAYNLKFGTDQHFFLVETGVSFIETYMNHLSAGYEYRRANGFVLRIDGGGATNFQTDSFLKITAHFGYAF